ncbi:MAG: sporulation protein YabP [Sulfobacillus acidophilus]|uniref:Sporulation protein YabP n=1 Tax=Sulfobacillus acidophilus TaxID=53633 RepID=A0A2T2WH64_9FIRM|nr:MAG: sporulation protein YabP [Sulfobacillus acidophilus]
MDDKSTHSITLVNRQSLILQGVQHVDSFDDDSIVLATTMGTMTIRGHSLKIQTLALDRGYFEAVGEFDALQYGRKKATRGPGSTWNKLWR